MTNEEWIEEIFIKAAEIGKYTELHEILESLQLSQPTLSFVKRLELAQLEIFRESSIEVIG